MNSMSTLDSTNSIVLAVGGTDLTIVITVIATIMLALSSLFLIAIAIGPHLSSEWADRFNGAVVEVDTDGSDAEGTA